MAAVSNSSPLICLAAPQDFGLLRRILGDLLIPEAVQREVAVDGQGRPGAKEVAEAIDVWIRVISVQQSKVARLRETTGLHAGEAESIVLASQLHIHTIVLDDRRAVREADARALKVVRTPAVYLAAKRAGLISEVKPKLDALRSLGFRLRDDHYRVILDRAGERSATPLRQDS